MQFKDQMDTIFELQKTPSRIVCLVPSLTELLVDLDLEDSIVGITKFCVHPKHLRKHKTIVGGTKSVHIRKIKNLEPDIILCNKEENTKEIVEECERIAPVHVSEIITIEDVYELIKEYGALFSCDKIALKLKEQIQEKYDNFKAFVKNKPVISVAYFIWKNPWMVAANKTFIHHMLTLNECKNIFETENRYPIIKQLSECNPAEFIFLSSEPYPFKIDDGKAFQKLQANPKVIIVNGEFFSWYGSRLLKAFDYFKELHTALHH